MDPVVHFEMPYEDKQRAADFYQKSFGWQPQMLGPEMGEYVVMTTTEMDTDSKFPKVPGQINGGLYKKSAEGNPNPSVVIAVKDIKASVEKVTQSGGKVLSEPVEIPGIGLYVSFVDTEGNRVSMLQPSPRM